MPYVKAYSQVVRADVDAAAWDETYFSLLSLKQQMQSLPGWQGFDLWAQPMPSGMVRVLAITNWTSMDQLSIWLQTNKTVDAILRAMSPPPQMIDADLYEVIL